MLTAKLTKLRGGKKKFTVVVSDDNKTATIHFGARGYSDYTMHADPTRKKRYIARHQAREDWTNPLTAGFWSVHLLWSETTIPKAIAKIKKRFGITIINKL